MELTKIAIRHTGAIHLIITENNLSPLNCVFPIFTSSAIVFGLITKPTKMQVKNARIGINTLLLIKSNVSKMERPINLMCDHIPNPSEDGSPIRSAMMVTTPQVNFLFQWNLSRRIDTMVSIKEMADVSAAKNTSRKNNVPITSPIGILSNTFGRVTNISPGP